MPELYCGFEHRPGEPPVGYPVACLPQAWSSGAVFMLLQACLGISIAGITRVVRIERPELPAEMSRLRIWGLAVGDARVDLAFERVGPRIAVTPIGPLPESVEVLVFV
jgi:glycogen debranching enzyme